MKLRNKLLPLIGTAAIAATATPLALTSCSSGLELIDITDGSKAIPTINPMDASWMGQKDWTTAYVKACKENPEIFRQDFIYGMYKRIVMESGSKTKVNYLKVGVSKPTFSTVNISYPGEPDVIYPTVSLTYQLQYSTEQTLVHESSYDNKAIVKDMKVTFKNVPFVISAYTEEITGETTSYKTHHYFRLPGMEESNDSYIWKFNLNEWTIDYSYTENTTITSMTQSGKTVQENTNSDSGTYQKYSDVSDSRNLTFLDCCFDSNYLSNVTLVPELLNNKIYAGVNTEAGAIPGGLTAGISYIPHKYFRGLYLPASVNYGLIATKDLRITVFADYDDEGNKLPIVLERVLPEGSTAEAKFLQIPVVEQKYVEDSAYSGWNAATVNYDGATYIPFQFPEPTATEEADKHSFFTTSDCTTSAALKPTITAAGTEAFSFVLPKYIWVQFTYYSQILEKDVSWDQQVWLSQEEMTLWGYFK